MVDTKKFKVIFNIFLGETALFKNSTFQELFSSQSVNQQYSSHAPTKCKHKGLTGDDNKCLKQVVLF